MKRNIKFKIAVLLILVILTSLINNKVNAYSLNVELNADKNLIPGEEINVTIKIKDLSVNNGIDAFMGTINYDKNVFENLTSSSFIATNGWNPLFNPKTNIFTLLNNTKVTNESDIVVIKFKVKSSSNAITTDIELNNISASGGAQMDGGTGDIYISDAKLTLAKLLNAETNTKVSSSISSNDQKSSDVKENISPKNATDTSKVIENSNNINTNVNEIYTNENQNGENISLDLYNALEDSNNVLSLETEKVNTNKNIILLVLGLVIIASGIFGYKLYKIKIANKKKN